LQGFVQNLVSVTTGNIFGGGFMVAAVYWFVYLRSRKAKEPSSAKPILGLLHETQTVQTAEQSE
jgi:hypothetical protein